MEIQQYEMESERLRFRRLRADDYALIAPILQDEQTMYAWEHGFTYDEVCDWIADMLRRYQQDGFGYFAALDKQTGELVALAGPLTEQLSADTAATGIGYIVRRDLWQQGYGRECAEASIRYAFDKLGAERVIAAIRPGNLASLHIAASCKMQVVGEILKHYRGKAMPHLICAIDKPKPEEKPPAQQTHTDQK